MLNYRTLTCEVSESHFFFVSLQKIKRDGDANKNAAYVKEVENGKFVFKEIVKID